MKHRDTGSRIYSIECGNNHSKDLTATELEDLIRGGEYNCAKCDSSVELTKHISLECHICTGVFEEPSLEEAKDTMDTGCRECQERGFLSNSIHVRNSWGYFRAIYDWKYNGPDENRLKHKDRTDYWEAVVHFCQPQEFVSIYRERKLRAAKTGYFGMPAVCFSETPNGNWGGLQDRHGPFGYVFLKRDLIAAGGGPAFYIPQRLIQDQRGVGFCDAIKPFVNLLRIPSVTPEKPKHDFLHEREWRLPHDLLFADAEPYAVVIGEHSTAIQNWEDIWGARIEFEELATEEEK